MKITGIKVRKVVRVILLLAAIICIVPVVLFLYLYNLSYQPKKPEGPAVSSYFVKRNQDGYEALLTRIRNNVGKVDILERHCWYEMCIFFDCPDENKRCMDRPIPRLLDEEEKKLYVGDVNLNTGYIEFSIAGKKGTSSRQYYVFIEDEEKFHENYERKEYKKLSSNLVRLKTQ